MTATINATTGAGGGIVHSSDASGELALQTAGVTALSIDASQNVALTKALPVASGGTGAITLTANNVLLGNGTSAVQVVAPGTSGNALVSNGTTWVSSKQTITSGTVVTPTAVTSVEFTGIPSWVKKITVLFTGIRTNASSPLLIQIGSGSYTTTGYVSSTAYIQTGGTTRSTSTFGYAQSIMSPVSTISGSSIIYLLSGNTYVNSGVLDNNGGTNTNVCAGTITISGVLDRLRIIGSSTGSPVDTFNAGSINILYE